LQPCDNCGATSFAVLLDRDGATARAVAQVADAVVIGSRIIQEMEQATPETCVEKGAAFLREIRGAMDA